MSVNTVFAETGLLHVSDPLVLYLDEEFLAGTDLERQNYRNFIALFSS